MNKTQNKIEERERGMRGKDCWTRSHVGSYIANEGEARYGVHQELVERSSGMVPGCQDKLVLSIIDAANRNKRIRFSFI